MKYLLITIFYLFISINIFADEEIKPYWIGHNVRLDLGTTLSFQQYSPKSGLNFNLEPFFEYGYEFGWVFFEKMYLSGGLSWTITYPRNFGEYKGFFYPPATLWYVPITHVQIGYVFKNDILLTADLIYIWGVGGGIRFPINNLIYFESKFILWLDRLLSVVPYKAFDSFHFSSGIGFHFF